MKVKFIKDQGHFKKGAIHIQTKELATKNIVDGYCIEFGGESDTEKEVKKLIKSDFSFAKKGNSEEE